MPSHIELNKNTSLPAASATDKLVFGVTSTNHAVLVDSSGTIIDLGGTGSIASPVPYVSYTAKLSETAPTDIDAGLLLVGETYRINNYRLGDDFSNVANIISGNSNSNGCVFVATGTTPNSWVNGTTLKSYGLPRTDAELDNTVGFTPEWIRLGSGTYAFNFSESVDYNKIVPYIAPTSTATLGSSIEINLQDSSYSFLDKTFNVGDGFEYGSGFDGGDVNAIVRQVDGKIIVGGGFGAYNGNSCNYIVRLNADGTIDRGFDIGSGFNGSVYTLAVQSDEKILVGGGFTSYNGTTTPQYICRLNTDGSIDTTFNHAGDFGAGFGDIVFTVFLQADGKILVGGQFAEYTDVTNGSTGMNGIIRLNTDGTYDTSFNNGYLGFAPDYPATVRSVVIQSDGKIICGGHFTTYTDSTGTYENKGIARLNTNGTFDTSFLNGSGYGFTSIMDDMVSPQLYSVALQSDGKILCGGRFDWFTDGTGGSPYNINCIARLNTDGTFDTSFAAYGSSGFNREVYSIAVWPDNSILVGGDFSAYNGNTAEYLVDLDSDGYYNGNFSGFDSDVYALYIQSDSKVIVGGDFSTYGGSEYAPYIIRLKGDGSIDSPSEFETGFNGGVYATVVQPDGKILVGGHFINYNGYYTSRIGITRLNADGKEDLTFNTYTGSYSGVFDFGNTVYSISLQSDGSIIIGGDFKRYNLIYTQYLAKLDATGSLDTTFTSNLGGGPDDLIQAIAIQPDGKIIIGGQFTQIDGVTVPYYICRLNADGTLDTTFNYSGGFGGGFDSPGVNAIKIQDDGKILVGGNFHTYNDVINGTTSMNNIIRLNTDGTYDTTFNNGGSGMENSKRFGRVFSIGIQSDGKIICGGTFSGYTDITNTYNSSYIARLDATGSFDTTFSSYNYGFNDNVYSILVQADDSIVAGGDFNDYNGTPLDYLVRLDKDGNILNNFYDYGGGLNNTVFTLSSHPFNKLIVGGRFGDYDGFGIGRYIARLYAGYDVTLISANIGSLPTDDVLNKTPIEIKLYN
jgi:uncharacterized delta-60 repeat protein